MPNKYTVKITTQAENHMREAVRYIADELKAPEAALHLIDELEAATSSLSKFPHRIALVDEEPWRSQGIRKLLVKNFFAYFWIDEEKAEVHVTAVVYGRRDQLKQLAHMQME